MAEGSCGLGHIVTPADGLARIAHDPQHVCERQLAGCGCFLPHLLVCTAGRSLGSASARPFSTVSAHQAIAQLIENRVLRYPVHLHYNYGTTFTTSSSARTKAVAAITRTLFDFFCPCRLVM